MFVVILTASGAVAVAGVAVGWLLRGRRYARHVASARAEAAAAAASLQTQLDAAQRDAADLRTQLESAEGSHQALAIEHNLTQKRLAEARASRTHALRELALARAESTKLKEALAQARSASPSRPTLVVNLRDCDDDLQQIRGIGPGFEKLLGAMEIRTYRQLAALTDEDAAKVERALDTFPGRIAQEEWREQARNLLPGIEV